MDPNGKSRISKLQFLPQLFLPCQIPRIVNRMLHCLPGHSPQRLPSLLRLIGSLLQLRIRPLKVERQIQIRLVLALGNSIIDKRAAAEIVEVDLSKRTDQSACTEDNSEVRGERWYLPRLAYLQILNDLSTRRSHTLFECHASPHECRVFLQHLRARHRRDEELGFAAFEHHDLPDLVDGEEGKGVGRVDGTCLRLVEDDHYCLGAVGVQKASLRTW